MQPTTTNHSIGTTPVKVLAANVDRKYLCVQNKSNGAAVVTVKVDGHPFVQAKSAVQVVSFDSVPNGGAFKLKLGAQTSGELLFSTTAPQLQTALEALSNVGAGNVVVSGDFDAGFTVTFQGALANTTVQALEAVANTLYDDTLQVKAVHVISFSTPPTAGTWRLSWFDQETGDLAFDISAAQLKTAIEALADFDGGPSGVTSVTQDGTTKAFTVTLDYDSRLVPFVVTENQLVDGTGVTNDVQYLYAAPAPVSGFFKLMVGAEITEALPYNASAGQIEAALEALPSIDEGNIGTAGSSLVAGILIQFEGALAGSNQLKVIPAENSLVGAGNTEVRLDVVQDTEGVSAAAVGITPAITTAGINEDAVTPAVAVTEAGNAQDASGFEILKGAEKTWEIQVPAEEIWVVANEASTPVEVLEG